MIDTETDKVEETPAKFKWDTFYYGPDGFDEHVGISSDSADDMSKGREAIIKSLKDIGAKPKGGKNGPNGSYYSAPTSTSPAAPVAPAPTPIAQAAGIGKVCPVHGTSMRPNTKGGIPGVTQHQSKAGKTYTCFWVCSTDQNCKER